MSKFKRFIPTILNWSIWMGLYLGFLWWHGVFATPLSTDEINQYAQRLHELRPNQPIEAYKEQLAKDNGNPIFMVNAIKYFEEPVKTPNQEKEIEAEQLVKTYNHFVGKFLIQRGSYPLYLGKATGGTAASWGVEDAEGWSEATVVRYRNLRTMVELATSEEFNEKISYKRAALEKTIVYPTEKRLMAGGLEYLVFFILLSVGLAIQLLLNLKFKGRNNTKTK